MSESSPPDLERRAGTLPVVPRGGAAVSPPSASRPVVAVLLMLGALTLLPLMDGLAKHLNARYPLAEVVWARYFFHLLVMLPFLLWRYGPRSLWPKRVGVQLLRGTLLLAATFLYFAALGRMPLADALALFFVSPLVVTVFAPRLLGEQVGLQRWLAVAVGFVGVCIVLRPGLGGFQWAALLAVAAGVVHGFYLLTTRKLSGSAPPLVTLAYTAVVGAVVMSVVTVPGWLTPAPGDLGPMVGMGILAATAHYLLIKSFDYASASLLAPLGYSEIVTATLVGYLLFGDFPDLLTWVGIAVVIASGAFISLRERQA